MRRFVPVLFLVAGVTTSCGRPATPPAPAASPTDPAFAPVGTAVGRFVGSEACASCHADQSRAWSASGHRRALAPVAAEPTPLTGADGPVEAVAA